MNEINLEFVFRISRFACLQSSIYFDAVGGVLIVSSSISSLLPFFIVASRRGYERSRTNVYRNAAENDIVYARKYVPFASSPVE